MNSSESNGPGRRESRMGRRFRGSIVSESFEINGGNNLAIEHGILSAQIPADPLRQVFKVAERVCVGLFNTLVVQERRLATIHDSTKERQCAFQQARP